MDADSSFRRWDLIGSPVMMCTDQREPVVVCVGTVDRDVAADAAYMMLAAHIGFERLEGRLELAAPEVAAEFDVRSGMLPLLLAVTYVTADLDDSGMNVGAGGSVPVTVVHCGHLVAVESTDDGRVILV